MSDLARITFLAGAGIGCDAGLPMSEQLATKLKESLMARLTDDDLAPTDRDQAGQLLALFRFLDGGVRFQEGFLNRDPDKPVNIEQIAVSALELRARLQNPLAPYAFGWHQRITELEAQQPGILVLFIDFIYSQLEKWLRTAELKDIAYLARLADFAEVAGGLDIFSLNYDLCIETALNDIANKPFTNGFTPDGWRSASFEEASQIRLFKLHGSLDWVEDEAYGVCSLKFPRHKDAEDIEQQGRPLLIFGTAHKLSARQPFLTLAYHFSECVLQTSILVIVGYSFGDAYVNDILDQGLRRNTQLKIMIASPAAAELVARNPLFNQNPRVTVLDTNARDVLNDGELLTRARELAAEVREEAPF